MRMRANASSVGRVRGAAPSGESAPTLRRAGTSMTQSDDGANGRAPLFRMQTMAVAIDRATMVGATTMDAGMRRPGRRQTGGMATAAAIDRAAGGRTTSRALPAAYHGRRWRAPLAQRLRIKAAPQRP